jgi:hypothetical protein
MNEMDELARMRASVREGQAGGRAQTALLEAIRAERDRPAGPVGPVHRPAGARRRVPLRPSLAVLAGSLSLVAATAAGVLITRPGTAPSVPAAPGLTVTGLAQRAAAAAGAARPVRGDQWVYFAGQNPDGHPSGRFGVWMTARASRAAWLRRGKLRFIRGPIGSLPIAIGGFVIYTSVGRHVIPYDRLGSLPRDPRALERYLASLLLKGRGSDPESAFFVAGKLLSTYVLPPRFEATLFRAVGLIPGVRVYSHFTDGLGRPGTGFLFSLKTGYQEAIVLDPNTFRFRSFETINPHPAGQQIRLTAPLVLREQPVSGPGVIPPGQRGS